MIEKLSNSGSSPQKAQMVRERKILTLKNDEETSKYMFGPQESLSQSTESSFTSKNGFCVVYGLFHVLGGLFSVCFPSVLEHISLLTSVNSRFIPANVVHSSQ